MRTRDHLSAKGAALVVVAFVWQAAARQVGPVWLPGPVAVGQRLWEEMATGVLLWNLVATAQLTAAGTFIGLVAGVAGACSLRLSPRLDRLLQPFISAMMSIPKLGLVPLLVLWFGTGWTPKVALVALTALFIVFAMTYSGLTSIDARLVMTTRVLGATTAQVTRSVVLPSLWPFVLTGLEVALPWCVSAALVAEYLSSKVGIGHGIEQARQVSDSTGVFSGIVAATFLVLVGNAALTAIRRISVKGPTQESQQ